MLTLLGIPTCDTCKKARAWLAAKGIAYEWVDLREAAPGEVRVAEWVAALGDKALRNTSGQSYRALGPKKDAMSSAEWTKAFARDPMLIKRPVLERDGHVIAVGFKPEMYAALL